MKSYPVFSHLHTSLFKNTVFRVSCIALLLFCIFIFIPGNTATTKHHGIYLTQATLSNRATVHYLIEHAKEVGIDTFVIDLVSPGPKYADAIKYIKNNGIRYVARVVVFPDGGWPEQVRSKAYLEKRYALVNSAIQYGADEIQLDYIRFTSKMPGNHHNAVEIAGIIQWFKDKIAVHHIPLEIDVFGETSFGESSHIGQNVKLIGPIVNAICPMTYPSHYEPYQKYALQPYQIIYKSLMALKAQFATKPTFKIYPYIELYNYRYPMGYEQKVAYIKAEIKATNDAQSDGWFVWNPHNKYDILFEILKEKDMKI